MKHCNRKTEKHDEHTKRKLGNMTKMQKMSKQTIEELTDNFNPLTHESFPLSTVRIDQFKSNKPSTSDQNKQCTVVSI